MNDSAVPGSIARVIADRKRLRPSQGDTSFRIFALLLNRTLGEFVDQNVFAATIKNMFDDATLYVYYRNDRPYKKQILEMNPHIDMKVEMEGKKAYPLDYFDNRGNPPIRHPDSTWYKRGYAYPHLVLTPSLMDTLSLRRFPSPARLRLPAGRREDCERRLVEMGVAPDRWFCTLHYREDSYGYRPGRAIRDHDPALFDALVSRIIDDLGGQVVRVGHPEMTAFAPRPGFVDLAVVDDGFPLQAAAIAAARFHLATPSGTCTIADAFGTPHAHVCEVAGLNACLHGPQDQVLSSHLLTPEGQRIAPRDLFSDAFSGERWKEVLVERYGFEVRHNSVDELAAMCRHMLAITRDTPGWRRSEEPDPVARPNRVTLPFPLTDEYMSIVEFPELAPEAPVLELPEGSVERYPIGIAPRRDQEWP